MNDFSSMKDLSNDLSRQPGVHKHLQTYQFVPFHCAHTYDVSLAKPGRFPAIQISVY